MKRLLFILPVILFAGVAIAFGFGLTRDPSRLPSVLIDKPLPAFDLPSVGDGVPALASAQLTGEPALLNLFASWCVPCRVEHPLLLRLADEGVAIHGIDWKEPATAGAAYLAQYGNPFRRVGSDPSGRAGIDLGLSGVPETFVVDGAGRVRYRHVGPITAADWNGTLKPLLAKLKAEGR